MKTVFRTTLLCLALLGATAVSHAEGFELITAEEAQRTHQALLREVPEVVNIVGAGKAHHLCS